MQDLGLYSNLNIPCSQISYLGTPEVVFASDSGCEVKYSKARTTQLIDESMEYCSIYISLVIYQKIPKTFTTNVPT